MFTNSPNGGSSQINMKVCPATFHTHQAILLHFGIQHVSHVIGSFSLLVFEVPWPHIVRPINLPYNFGSRHQVFQFGLRKFQTDNIQFTGAIWTVVILIPFFHRHFTVLLSGTIHDINYTTSSNDIFDICHAKVWIRNCYV